MMEVWPGMRTAGMSDGGSAEDAGSCSHSSLLCVRLKGGNLGLTSVPMVAYH